MVKSRLLGIVILLSIQCYGSPAVAVPQLEIHPRVPQAGAREKPPAQQSVNPLNHILAGAWYLWLCLQLSVCRLLLLKADAQKRTPYKTLDMDYETRVLLWSIVHPSTCVWRRSQYGMDGWMDERCLCALCETKDPTLCTLLISTGSE